MDQNKIGSFIAELRKEKALTQESLAEILGVSSKSVSRWENGKNLPDAALYQPLCQTLGISLTELLNGERIDAEERTQKAEESVLSIAEFAKKKIKSVNKRFTVTLAVCLLLVTGLIVTLNLTVLAPGPCHEGDVSKWQNQFPPHTAYRMALNEYDMPVFVNPGKAMRQARKDYADAIRTVRWENHLFPLPLCRLCYTPYKIYGWQTITDDEILNRQCIYLSAFLDIYENSYE